MEMFQFGDRVTHEFRGQVRTVGEWALHLIGGWRIVTSGRVLVGRRDFWIPARGVSDDDFNPNFVGVSRRDELMEKFVAHGESAHRVESVSLSEAGDLRLVLTDGCVLETLTDLGFVEPADDETNECWRLVEPATDLPHIVARPGGVIDYE